jgi:hypothetical protein
VLVRAVLVLLRILALAVLVLVTEGGAVLALTVGVTLEVFVFTMRLAFPFPLFAFSVVQATLEIRSVNTARAKTFLIIISFKAAASGARRIREASQQMYIPYSPAKIIALCKLLPGIPWGYG